MYIYTYIHTFIYIYIYIHTARPVLKCSCPAKMNNKNNKYKEQLSKNINNVRVQQAT